MKDGDVVSITKLVKSVERAQDQNTGRMLLLIETNDGEVAALVLDDANTALVFRQIGGFDLVVGDKSIAQHFEDFKAFHSHVMAALPQYQQLLLRAQVAEQAPPPPTTINVQLLGSVPVSVVAAPATVTETQVVGRNDRGGIDATRALTRPA